MFLVKILLTIVIITIGAIFLKLLIENYDDYQIYTKVLIRKDFVLKELIPFGLYILDKHNYSFDSGYDRRMLVNICEVYGQEFSAFYIRVFYACKIVLIVLWLVFELLIGILLPFKVEHHIYLLILFSVLVVLDDFKLKDRVKRRRLEIQIEFPEFINKLTLLLNAGLTISKAWEKISTDSDKKGDFYVEISKTALELKAGKNEAEAFSNFAKRMKTPEISRFMSTLVQNTKRGGDNLVLSLRLQSSECWDMRKNTVKRLGEEASTKLLLPMMIMFFAIIIIVVTPAIISMQGI